VARLRQTEGDPPADAAGGSGYDTDRHGSTPTRRVSLNVSPFINIPKNGRASDRAALLPRLSRCKPACEATFWWISPSGDLPDLFPAAKRGREQKIPFPISYLSVWHGGCNQGKAIEAHRIRQETQP
jgi:hypothetical protein